MKKQDGVIEVVLVDNQKLIISNLKKGKFKTDDGMRTAKGIIDVFVKSIEIWVDQINRMMGYKGETLKFFISSHGSKEKAKIAWCKGIQKDINVIAKFSNTKIVKIK